ncbi:MAG: patatin-like phospholipase family protein [Amaricoccus sp.]
MRVTRMWSGAAGPLPVHLGLQGGGAHGAVTWGVLDRLLEAERFAIRAVSGTSAGAMNAVVLADGLARGGPAAARTALADFWQAVGQSARLSPVRRGVIDQLRGRDGLDHSLGYLMVDGLSRLVPPRTLNPRGLDPLREILAARVDFERVAQGSVSVHVAATEVATGRPRVFSGPQVGVEAVLASACLPQLYPAVEIDGTAYWDGGFSANPALAPLVADTSSRDIVIVQLNPVVRPEVPCGARQIINRMGEIGFNAPLVAELDALARRRGFSRPRLHRIAGGETPDLVASGRLDADPAHLTRLFEEGRRRAEIWLAGPAALVGRAGTLDRGEFRSASRGAPPRRRAG